MAVAFDAASSNFWVAPNNGSLSHVPVGTPKGVIVGVLQSLVTSDDGDIVAGVTYGGVAMTRLEHVVDAAGEIGHAYLYFLGASIPTGSQTVAVDTNGTNDAMWACCVTVTAAADTEVADSGATSGDVANPSITLATASGFAGHVFAALFSGQNAPSSVTAGSGYTKRGTDRDFGSQSGVAESGDKSGANVVANFTVAIEDVAMVAAAIQEATGVTGSSTISGGGALSAATAKGGVASSSARGGGALSATATKAATATSTARGGGTIVSTGSAGAESHSGTSSVSGGGAASSTIQKGAAASSSARGGGTTVATARKGGTGTSTVRGGGTGVAAGYEGGLTTTGVSGGGGVTSTGRKAATGTSSVRGGGSVTSTGSAGVPPPAASGASSVRGGGTVTGAALAARAATSFVRGGGQSTASASRAASATSAITGGGRLVAVWTSTKQATSFVRGGGNIVSVSSSIQPASPAITSSTRAGPARGTTMTSTASGRTQVASSTGRTGTMLEEG